MDNLEVYSDKLSVALGTAVPHVRERLASIRKQEKLWVFAKLYRLDYNGLVAIADAKNVNPKIQNLQALVNALILWEQSPHVVSETTRGT